MKFVFTMGEQSNKEHLFYLNFYDANNNIGLNGNLGAASNMINLNSHGENNRNSEFSMYDGTLTNLANIIQSASANFEYELMNKFIANLNVNNSKHDVNMNHNINELDLKNLDNLLIKSKWSIKLSNDIDNGLKSTKFLIEQNSINVKANIIFENCSLECDSCKLNINLNNLTKLFVKIFRLTLNHKIEDMILFVNKYSLISIVLMIERHKCNMRYSYLQAVLKNFVKCLVDILSSKFFSSLTSLQSEISNNLKMEEYSKLPNEINCLLENLDNIFYQNKHFESSSGSVSKSNEKPTPCPDVFMMKNQLDQPTQENRMSSSMKSNEIILKAINKRKLQISCPLCSSKVLNMSDHLLKKHLIKDRKQRKNIMDSIRKTFLDMSTKSLTSNEYNCSGDPSAAECSSNGSIQVKSGNVYNRKSIKCPICEDNKHFVNISDHLIKIHHLIDSEKRRPILKQIKQRKSSKASSSSKNSNSNNRNSSSHNSNSSNLNENPNSLLSSECASKSSESEKAPLKKINKRKQKKTTKLVKMEEEGDLNLMKNNDNLCDNNLRDTCTDEYQAQEQENLFDHHQHRHHHRHHNNHSPKTTNNNFNSSIVVNEKKFDYLAQHSSESHINEVNKRTELSYSKTIEFLENNEFESNRPLHHQHHHSHNNNNNNHVPIDQNLEKSQELDKDIEFDINSEDLLHEQTSSLIGEQRCLDSNENLNEFFENNTSDLRLSNTSSHGNNNNTNTTSNLNHSLSMSQQLYQSNEHVLNRLVQIEDNLNSLMNSFSSLSEIINKQMRSFSCQLEYTFNEVKSLKNSLLLSPSNQSLESLMSNNNNNNHLTSNHNNADTLNDLSSNHQVNLNDAFNFDNNNNTNNNLNNNKHICNTDHSSSISSSSSSSSIVNFQHFIQPQDTRMISIESNVIDSFEDENHANMNHTVQLHSTAHEEHHHSHHNGNHLHNKNNFDFETETNLSENSETNFYENIDRDFYQKQMEILAGEKLFLRTSKFTNNSAINSNNSNFNQISKSVLIDSIKSTNKRVKVKQNL